ncbi:MAG: 3-deoxy-manno-octulosonate cytidylyltransferase, partial [Mesorhizobium sp.]
MPLSPAPFSNAPSHRCPRSSLSRPVHVARRGAEAGLGRVVVATDTEAVAEAVRTHGFEAVMTRDDHQSGSDRIFEALNALDPEKKVETIVNVQGDLPTIDPQII